RQYALDQGKALTRRKVSRTRRPTSQDRNRSKTDRGRARQFLGSGRAKRARSLCGPPAVPPRSLAA
ncbi:unnamed protein product, partial [Amoebophrya sp. A120]